MGFKLINNSEKEFIIVKQHLINKEGFIPKYCILDSRHSTPYYFLCPNCKKNSTNIDHLNAHSFDSNKIKVNINSIIEMGGTGTISKLISCQNCLTNYFVGIGYIEPNNGRDVLLLHTIIELKEK
jgi:hypothetical protein